MEMLRKSADAKPPVYELQREGLIPMRQLGG